MRRIGFLLGGALILLDLAFTVRFVAMVTLAIAWAVAARTAESGSSPRRHYLVAWLAAYVTAFVMVLSEAGASDLAFVGILAFVYGTWQGTAAWLIAAGNRDRVEDAKPGSG